MNQGKLCELTKKLSKASFVVLLKREWTVTLDMVYPLEFTYDFAKTKSRDFTGYRYPFVLTRCHQEKKRFMTYSYHVRLCYAVYTTLEPSNENSKRAVHLLPHRFFFLRVPGAWAEFVA